MISSLNSLVVFGVPALVAAFGIFWLPYMIGPFAPMSSVSYGVAYNNAVAVLALWTAVVIGYGIARLSPSGRPPGPLLSSTTLWTTDGVTRRHLAWACVLYLLLTVLVATLLGTDDFSEQGYFMRRLYLALGGLRPWLDFEFAYGPAFIHLPALFARILDPVGVEPRVAYQLLYALMSVVGVVLLYVLVQAAALGRRRAVTVFWLLAIALWYPFLGLNSNLLRFTAAPASLVLLDLMLRDPRYEVRRALAGTLAAVTLVGANLMLSPELGTSYWIAACIYLLHRCLNGQRAAIPMLAVSLLLPVALFAWEPAYMGSVLTYAGGGASFPIVPAPHILLYLFGVVLLLPREAAHASRPGIGNDSLNLALVALAMALVPGALGRSDPGHVVNYGLVSFVLVFALAARRRGAAFRVYAIMFCVVLTLGNQLTNAYIIKRDIAAGMYLGLREFVPEATLTRGLDLLRVPESGPGSELRVQIAAASRTPAFDALLKFPALGLPMRVAPGIERFLRVHGRLAPDYYLDNLNVFSVAQMARKIDDTNQHEFVLVREAYLERYGDADTCYWDSDWSQLERYLTFLYKFPIALPKRNRIPYHRCLIVENLAENFTPVLRLEDHVVMQRRDAASR